MKNHLYNLEKLLTVANALGDLHKDVVYVGGSVVSLYADNPSAEDIRPTIDVDFFAEIASYSDLEKFSAKLKDRGFYQSSEDSILCRFRFQDLIVDVMSTKEIAWAPANPWFGKESHQTETIKVQNIAFNLLSTPYFLASKFSAFSNRAKDPRMSHDFEDIVYILNNNSNWENEISAAHEEVRNFLFLNFKSLLNSPPYKEAILGNLSFNKQMTEYEKIMGKISGLFK